MCALNTSGFRCVTITYSSNTIEYFGFHALTVSQPRSPYQFSVGIFLLYSIRNLRIRSQHCFQGPQLQLLLYFQCFRLISTVLILQTNLCTLVSHYPIFPPRIVEPVTQSTCDLVDIRTPPSAHQGNHYRFCFHSQGTQDPGKQLKTK